jgi:hypothetical protein
MFPMVSSVWPLSRVGRFAVSRKKQLGLGQDTADTHRTAFTQITITLRFSAFAF